MFDLTDKLREAQAIWRTLNMTESSFSQEVVRRVPGTMTIENSVAQGTPDLCVPTANGWLWVELKLSYRGRFLLKKSQYASLVADQRVLPQNLHRVFWIKGPQGYSYMWNWEVIEAKKEPTDRGIWITIPEDYYLENTLEELLAEFMCLRPTLSVV